MIPTAPLILVRHGQTDANRNGRIAGRTEAQLTPEGCADARALADWLWPDAIALFTSPQHRARETARLGFPDHPPVVLEGMRERDWGVFEGRPVSDLPPRHETPQGGESWCHMLYRVSLAIVEAHRIAAGRVPVLVAHSGVIRAVRQLSSGSAHGPSPANVTPYLFVPQGSSWRETKLAKKAVTRTA